MSLLAAVLWVVATVLGHLALRAMSHGDPRWNRSKMTDAIAGVCALASLALFFYTRRDDQHPVSFWISGSCTWCSLARPRPAHALGPTAGTSRYSR